jgi:GNAT superfamily N-acetyltransferase
MQIEQVDLTDTEKIRACHEVYLAAERIDTPEGPWLGEGSFATWMTVGWEGTPREVWTAVGPDADVAGGSGGDSTGGSVLGWYRLALPELTNVERAGLNITVHPAARRRGIGRALLRHAAGRAAAHERTVLESNVTQGSPGEAFARSAGADLELLTEIKRVMEVGQQAEEMLARLRGPVRRAAAGYSVVSWKGPVPEEFIEQAAQLYAALNDAPHSPGTEPEMWDAQRVRERINAPRAARKLHDYSVAARHDASGELAALTEVAVDPADPAWGHQMITAVIKPHRGHRLGLLVKLAMQDLLATAEPELKRIVTWNAEVNDHMIGVNEALGYTISGAPGAECRVDVAAMLG